MCAMKLDSKYFDTIRTKRRGTTRKPEPVAPTCQWDGCEENGGHRAPVGRNAENQYFMFCFEHVKEYNKGYNYFSGLSDNEIARYQKEALTGHRPTWTLGVNRSAKNAPEQGQTRSGSAGAKARMSDPFGFLHEARARRPQPEPRQRKLKTLETKAFDTLGLTATATSTDIKTAYKDLVKKHHPDANGGDRGSEDRFREVVQAYQLLKQAGFC
ncbi:molecular chaperone DnaJ [Rhizobium sp. Leaf371]|uniref:J domain-containing protein n=1 Tax=unclassified Rhizobium TaxID=2613769 RepID=UPI00071574FD|nr:MULTISPECIES: J domain-containing protein [unclassified Rhizobium]KQS64467.1 molecular chaperone DnaJ [Rhizobium sp. Leaf371]